MRLLTCSIVFFAVLGIGSYFSFYPERIIPAWLTFVSYRIPVAVGLVIAFILYYFLRAYQNVEQMLHPKQGQRNSLIKYKHIRDTIKTGDVFAFSGNGLGSLPIKIGTHSQYTHVGMVLKIKMPKQGYRIFFIQADEVKGVILVRLSSQLLYYNGSANWLKLRLPGDSAQKIEDAIYDHAMDQLGKGYDFLAIEGFVEKFFHIVNNKINSQDNNSFICSQLVAWILKKEKLIDEKINPAKMSPGQVVKLDCFEENVPII